MPAAIREYRSEDRDPLRQLARELYQTLLPADFQFDPADPAIDTHFEQIQQIKSNGRGQIFVAEDVGRVVGFVCITGLIAPQGQDAVDEPYAFLSDFYVQPRYQCRGVGAALMKEAERYAYGLGARRVALKVLAENTHAVEFYTKHRYQARFIVMAKHLDET